MGCWRIATLRFLNAFYFAVLGLLEIKRFHRPEILGSPCRYKWHFSLKLISSFETSGALGEEWKIVEWCQKLREGSGRPHWLFFRMYLYHRFTPTFSDTYLQFNTCQMSRLKMVYGLIVLRLTSFFAPIGPNCAYLDFLLQEFQLLSSQSIIKAQK